MTYMSESKIRFFINLVASLFQFIISMGIGFILTPYIVQNVSVEAYGFVGLTNNMVGYASLLTIALNSVAGRFITISWHRQRKDEAADIMSSVVAANICLAILLIFISSMIVYFLEYLIDIPNNLTIDVKILFMLIAINFSCSIINVVFSVATFITDKLYLSSCLSIITALLRVGILVGLFYFFPANIVYVGIAALICTVVELLVNIWYKNFLIPELKLSMKRFSKVWISKLVRAGIWNSLGNLGCMLLDGFDLLICNLWLGPYFAGLLSISKVLQSAIGALLQKISALFSPRLTMNFAMCDIGHLVKTLKVNMRMTGIVASIVYASVVALGQTFFELWMPNSDTEFLYRLTIISLSGLLVSGVVYGLPNVYLITDHMKANPLVIIVMGIINICLVLLMLHFTDMGIYAVVGVSVGVKYFSDLFFAPMYAAYCLNLSLWTFYGLITRYLISTVSLVLFFVIVSTHCLDKSVEWSVFFTNCVILIFLGLVWNGCFLLDKTNKKRIYYSVKKLF